MSTTPDTETTTALAPTPAPEAPQALLPAGRVHGVVAAHLEPVTRFDAADLQVIEAEEAFGMAVQLTLDQAVSFELRTRAGVAWLAAGTDKVAGHAALEAELHRRLRTAIDEAPAALKQWADQEPGSYRRLLPVNAAFRSAPGAVGYEHTCTTCSGRRRLTCTACGGEGSNHCHGCHGAGRINCYSCHGRQNISCNSCSGRGSWTEQVSEQRWDSSAGSYVTQYRSEYRSCPACSSSGTTTCYSCDYAGKIGCSACFSRGRVDCGPCGATGQVDCSACLASGVQHVWGTVVAQVEREDRLSVAHDDEALRRLVHDKVPLAELPALGELLDVRHNVGGMLLHSEHRLRLDVLRAGIGAQGENFVIHGFGPAPSVFCFENIAGRLLTSDLQALEQRVAASSRWCRQRGGALLDTTAAFLRSELNMLIAERVAGLDAPPEQAAEQVRRQFRDLVDASYVERATRALRGALARLYGSELLEPAAYLCGLAALGAGTLYGLGWPAPGALPATALSLGAALLGWIVLEWLTQRRIGRRFDPAFAARVRAQLAANGSRRRWRIGAGSAAIAAVALGIVGTQQLPFVRDHQAQQRQMLQAQAVLAQWSQQPRADFRQRQYPARALLDRQAAAGETRAQLVLAWQLLLGAGGQAKDVATAGSLLDQAEARAAADPLWRAAKAVHLLNQEAEPDAIRAAARDLDQAAGRGLAEARYWEARIYLETRSPAFDERRGLQSLRLAADGGHARAALMLGERLAAGQGLRRDVPAARRYLQRAAGEGLTEAHAALAKLR